MDPATPPGSSDDVRVGVLASGSGTNVQALLDDAFCGPRIAVVVSDRADARALVRASERGVPAVFLDPSALDGRVAFGRALLAVLAEHDVGVVALAGFMRILPPEVVHAFEGRMVNVHPALLPAFPGGHAVADALEWGAKVTGVTVHIVDDEVDHGPIVFQEAVAVHDDDDWDALESRIHEAEHRLLPRAVRALAEGRVRVDGRRVTVAEPASMGEP